MEDTDRLTEDRFTSWRSWVMEGIVISFFMHYYYYYLVLLRENMLFNNSGTVFNGVRGVSLLNMYIILKDNFFFYKCKKFQILMFQFLMFCTRCILHSVGILVIIFRIYVMSAMISGKLSFIGISYRKTHAFIANATKIVQFSIIN